MKILTISTLVAAQILAAQPAAAADLVAQEQQRIGAFAGLRLRVPLDGANSEGGPRLGVALAPTLHGRNDDAGRELRIGEGVEIGFRAGRPLALSVGGRELTRRQLPLQDAAEEGDGGIPTWALVAGGVVVALGGAYLWFSEAIDCDEDEECS